MQIRDSHYVKDDRSLASELATPMSAFRAAA